MGFERGGRGRGRGFQSGERGRPGFRGRGAGNFRGGSGDRGRGGFRGASDRGAPRGGAFRGGERGSGGRGFGGRGFGGFRGNDSRGSFRGADRGFRGASRGRGGFGDQGRPKAADPFGKELQDGLSLLVTYKNVPSVEDTKKQLAGFHSRTTRPSGKDSSGVLHILMFTDMQSVDAAKTVLEGDQNVETVEFMGFRSGKKGVEAECNQLYLRFESPKDEKAIKELDERIQSVEFKKENTSCLVKFATPEEAAAALKTLSEKVGTNSLAFVRESFGTKNQKDVNTRTDRRKVVLRDVPKDVTLKEVAAVFPDAVSFALFDKTFPVSKYCHAAIRFKTEEEATKVLENKDLKIRDKKIYVIPAYESVLQDVPSLGKMQNEEVKAAAQLVKETSGPPNKKMKFEKNSNGKAEAAEEEESGDEEEMEEDADENEEESEDEEGEDEEEEEGDDDEEDDDDDDDE